MSPYLLFSLDDEGRLLKALCNEAQRQRETMHSTTCGSKAYNLINAELQNTTRLMGLVAQHINTRSEVDAPTQTQKDLPLDTPVVVLNYGSAPVFDRPGKTDYVVRGVVRPAANTRPGSRVFYPLWCRHSGLGGGVKG